MEIDLTLLHSNTEEEIDISNTYNIPKKYFDNTWEIISCRENNFPTFEGAHVDGTRDHFHRFGYILARKI